MIGQKFGKLLVISREANRIDSRGKKKSRWLCQCECGSAKIVLGSYLRCGTSKSCGCAKSEFLSQAKTTHGHGRKGKQTPTYRSWSEMIARCNNPKSRIYSYYGGRGITVCPRWRKFENFLADMGARPDGTSLDRWPNVNGNYEYGNCRWATKKEQARNRRSNCIVNYNGEKLTLTEAAERENIPYWQAYKFSEESVRDQRRTYKRDWVRADRKANPARYRANKLERAARVLRATPPWVNKKQLSKIYKACPIGYHVDHIIPIKGKNVSGLHVPWNLQYLSPAKNFRKNNRLEQAA